MSDTVVSVLTPAGRGAIATLGVAGPRAWEAVRALFTPRSGVALPETPEEGGRWWLGKAGDELADDAVLAVRRAGPTPLIELHVHGGREVSRYLVERLADSGVRQVGWDEFLIRDESDPFRADAAVALTRASTPRVAAILLDQYHGALRREIETGLADIEARAELGRHLTEPFRVVVAGAPNVGKSSLVNALAGYQRSVVSPSPGTTRDVVTAALAIDGWPVELADTAGLREGGESLEEAGIEQARLAAAGADLCLWVVDAADRPAWPGTPAANLRVVVNKIDRPAAWDLAEAGDAPRVSATTGEGLGVLCDAISRWLVPRPPPPGAGVPLNEAQVAVVRAAVAGAVVPPYP